MEKLEIGTHTRFCGVIGNPVEHSLSPAIHNAAFQALGIDCVYLAWKVEEIGDALRGLRALGNFCGASVTIPHKVTAVQFVDEIEQTARQIGAINTIVADHGRLIGYNTDATGALRALRERGVALDGRRIVLLGTGGAARAIAFALAAESSVDKLILLGVDGKERAMLARDLQAKTGLAVEEDVLDERSLVRTVPGAQVLIHCTPIGMFPKADATCVPASLLHPGLAVMDIVYNPRTTRLLKEAGQAGCTTIPGLDMFLNQAVAQFELWTNRPAPVDVMRAVLESHVQ